MPIPRKSPISLLSTQREAQSPEDRGQVVLTLLNKVRRNPPKLHKDGVPVRLVATGRNEHHHLIIDCAPESGNFDAESMPIVLVNANANLDVEAFLLHVIEDVQWQQ